MPSEPPRSSSSSSAAKPSSSSSAARPSSSSSSSSSSSKPPSNGDAKPPQPTPVISANAWMSFFLFCCLVLIILQAPLGLNAFGGASTIFRLPAAPWGSGLGLIPSVGGFGGLNFGGMPGCGGVVAGMVPWCNQQMQMPGPMMAYAQPQPQVVYDAPQQPPIIVQAPRQPQRREHQMGGQGQIATPGGGAGWSWYANNDGRDGGEYRRNRDDSGYRQVQYQRSGVQVQVTHGRAAQPYQQQQQDPPLTFAVRPRYSYPHPASSEGYYAAQAQGQAPQLAIPAQVIPAQPIPLPPVAAVGLANLENAFYPLLIGAIALLVLFDYAS